MSPLVVMLQHINCVDENEQAFISSSVRNFFFFEFSNLKDVLGDAAAAKMERHTNTNW